MPAKGQKRKQQIIDSAKDMFINNGFQSTHIGQVCEKLDIARGTVYQYFGNKREILYAVLDQVEEQIDDINDADELKDFIKSDPSQKALAKFVNEKLTASIRVIVDEPIVMKLIYKDVVGIDKEVISRVNKFLDYTVSIVKRDIDELVKKGIYKKNLHAEIAATMLIGGILFLLYSFEQKGKNVLEKDVVEAVVTNHFEGMLK